MLQTTDIYFSNQLSNFTHFSNDLGDLIEFLCIGSFSSMDEMGIFFYSEMGILICRQSKTYKAPSQACSALFYTIVSQDRRVST